MGTCKWLVDGESLGVGATGIIPVSCAVLFLLTAYSLRFLTRFSDRLLGEGEPISDPRNPISESEVKSLKAYGSIEFSESEIEYMGLWDSGGFLFQRTSSWLKDRIS